jgi:hypothetical protein
MKTYLAEIIPRIKRYSERLDNLTLLTNRHWVVINELQNSKFVYIFRDNNELIISQNGKVEKGKWEYLGNDSLLIESKNDTYLFRHGFFDSNILALKVDGSEEYAFLVNENNYAGDLNSLSKVLDFLEAKYLKIIPAHQLVNDSVQVMDSNTYNELIIGKELNVARNDFGKYGYLDRDGNTVVDFIYDGAYDFSEELARVYRTIDNIDVYGFIDRYGNEVVSLKYEYAICFSEGLAVVRLNRKFGYIDNTNKIIIAIEFDDAISFHDGKAKVKKDKKYYYIKPNGEATTTKKTFLS